MKWGKDLVKWCAAELPAVITDLADQGPVEVFDELAIRYKKWLESHGPRLGVPQTNPPPKGSPAAALVPDQAKQTRGKRQRSGRK